MKAVLITWEGEKVADRKVVTISDNHEWKDGPYVDTVPFAVGSNQTLAPLEDYPYLQTEVIELLQEEAEKLIACIESILGSEPDRLGYGAAHYMLDDANRTVVRAIAENARRKGIGRVK